LGPALFIHKGIILRVKRVKFISDRMSYITPRGRWSDVSVLDVHEPSEDKHVAMSDSLHEELECVFDKIQKYHMKILLGNVNAEVGREDIFKQTVGNESLHEIVMTTALES